MDTCYKRTQPTESGAKDKTYARWIKLVIWMPTGTPASIAAVGLSITPNTTPVLEAGATDMTSAASQEYK